MKVSEPQSPIFSQQPIPRQDSNEIQILDNNVIKSIRNIEFDPTSPRAINKIRNSNKKNDKMKIDIDKARLVQEIENHANGEFSG